MGRVGNVAELRTKASFGTKRGSVTFLPEPEPREIFCPIVSADDHFLEPLTMFDSLPASLRESAPAPVWDEDGVPYWVVNGEKTPITIMDGAVGRPFSEYDKAPQKFDEFRDGVHDVDARIRDMDLNGVWAALNFPSTIWGFCGTQFARIPDRAAGLASVQAYNDWVLDWCGHYPDRFIPCQIPWMADSERAATEVRWNAARGFKAISFSENPEALGLPSLYTNHWDPLFEACMETETVINLHVGSSGSVIYPSADSPREVPVALFPLNGLIALIDWIYARVPLKFPDIRIALSEAGASWVPMAYERLGRVFRQRDGSKVWSASDPDPAELVRRNFWFTSIEDPSAFRMLDIIGDDRVMVESDYPHTDSSWPDTQDLLRRELHSLPDAVIRKVCFENACNLYRHPLPSNDVLNRSELSQGN